MKLVRLSFAQSVLGLVSRSHLGHVTCPGRVVVGVLLVSGPCIANISAVTSWSVFRSCEARCAGRCPDRLSRSFPLGVWIRVPDGEAGSRV